MLHSTICTESSPIDTKSAELTRQENIQHQKSTWPLSSLETDHGICHSVVLLLDLRLNIQKEGPVICMMQCLIFLGSVRAVKGVRKHLTGWKSCVGSIYVPNSWNELLNHSTKNIMMPLIDTPIIRNLLLLLWWIKYWASITILFFNATEC